MLLRPGLVSLIQALATAREKRGLVWTTTNGAVLSRTVMVRQLNLVSAGTDVGDSAGSSDL